jgi:CTD small phosphatase-like protein 2
MDETLIAAKFEGRIPTKFEKTFSYKLQGVEVSVRLRPYVIDCLEKLAPLYEIIVFTAGQQDYADYILDYIDTSKKIFKRRLYR